MISLRPLLRICSVLSVFASTAVEGQFVSAGGTQLYNVAGGGTCTYINSKGQSVALIYEADETGRAIITGTDPSNIRRPYEELNSCLKSSQGFGAGVTNLIQSLFPGQSGVASSSSSGSFASAEPIPNQRRKTYEYFNSGTRSGATGANSFASSGSFAGPGSSAGSGVCSYVDSSGVNVRVGYSYDSQGRLKFPGTSRSRHNDKRRQLNACRNVNTRSAQNLYNQLSSTQLNLQHQFNSLTQNILRPFAANPFFGTAFPFNPAFFGKKKK